MLNSHRGIFSVALDLFLPGQRIVNDAYLSSQFFEQRVCPISLTGIGLRPYLSPCNISIFGPRFVGLVDINSGECRFLPHMHSKLRFPPSRIRLLPFVYTASLIVSWLGT
jgi:hypothetical protein